jgi:hypothetical protein
MIDDGGALPPTIFRQAVSPINSRLVTPAIVLVSFAAALGLTRWRSGAWRHAPASAAPVAMAPAVRLQPDAMRSPLAPPAAVPESSPPQQPPVPPDPPAETAAAQPADTTEFLAAQDRAAAHSARSR